MGQFMSHHEPAAMTRERPTQLRPDSSQTAGRIAIDDHLEPAGPAGDQQPLQAALGSTQLLDGDLTTTTATEGLDIETGAPTVGDQVAHTPSQCVRLGR